MNENGISYSEIKAFSKCPKSHYWNYTRNLTQRQIEVAPDIGILGHAALDAYYKGEDWQIASTEAFDTMVKEKYPLAIEEYKQIEDCMKTVNEIIPRYFRNYPFDNFKLIASEYKFRVPIPGTHIFFKGYLDAVIEDKAGHLWLMEHKFPQATFRTEEDTILDTQTGFYQWACIQSGFNIVGTIYNQIKAKRFEVPDIITKGRALSKAKKYIDWETYARWVLAYGFDISDYMDMEEKCQPETSRRHYIYRSKDEINRFGRLLAEKTGIIKSLDVRSYMNESSFNCNTCLFKPLCIETMKGGDVEGLIHSNYMIKGNRNKPNINFDPTEEGEILL